MSGRVDPLRVKKQSFDVFRVMHSVRPAVRLLGHWNYPPEAGDATGPGRNGSTAPGGRTRTE